MKRLALLSAGVVAAGLLLAACGHVSLSSEGDPHRVLIGAVDYTPPSAGDAGGPEVGGLPGGAEILVRVLDLNPASGLVDSASAVNPAAPPLFNGQNSALTRATTVGPQVIGEQTIRDPGASPVPFRVEYTATDDQLRHGLAIEARISYDGRIQYANANQYEVTLDDVGDSHTIRVERMR